MLTLANKTKLSTAMTDMPFIDRHLLVMNNEKNVSKKTQWKEMLCPRIRSKIPYSAPYMTQEAQNLCLIVSVTN
jgi:hypothetical protein